MAPPAPEPSREATSGETQRSTPTPFLTKSYKLVDDQATDDVVSWNAEGSTFVVWNTTAFARDLLPKYFKHNNFSSFVRQLNTYGFKKVVPDRWEFSHECFRRGEKQLLREIQRRKMPASPPAMTVIPAPASIQTVKLMTSPSSSSGDEKITCGHHWAAELADENERLRKENMILSKELAQMKSLCSNIFSLMSSYNGSQSGRSDRETKPLELLPDRQFPGEAEEANGEQEDSPSPRLFGVPIGVKRPRDDLLQRPHGNGSGEIKSQPSDCHGEPWFRQYQSHRSNQRAVYN